MPIEVELHVLGEPVCRPSPSDLSWTSETLGLELPPSYVRFAGRYGRGVIDEQISLLVPTRAVPDNLVAASGLSQVIRDDVEGEWAEFAPDGSPELALRLAVFGTNWNGGFITWDTADAVAGEFAVYTVAEGSLAFVNVGYGVDALLWSLCSSDVKRSLGIGYEPLRRRFRPLPLTEESLPPTEPLS